MTPEIQRLRDIVEIAHAGLAAPGPEVSEAVERVIALLAAGEIRAAEPDGDGSWRVNEWAKKAILLLFRQRAMKEIRAGELAFHDKIGLWSAYAERGARGVPGAIVREGAYVAPKCVLMPCFVNIGAHVGEETMVDTWATIGSCAQIGRRCHVSGGVGIGGVLEPLQAAPVVVEDDCFIGARSEVVEGVRVGEGAVLAMGCYLGASTKIYDAVAKRTFLGAEGIPPRSVVVPGSLPSSDGTHHAYALIIKKRRDARTDARTALTEALR
jgi:2,3,4,5-tetrahydropyridine-2-carboxylate N-succinyltransferase